jgi:hypothetical protein
MFDIGERIISNLLTVGGIAGLIALTITVTLCARYFRHGPEEPPEVLKFALTAIIEFYFGTATAPSKLPTTQAATPTASAPNK